MKNINLMVGLIQKIKGDYRDANCAKTLFKRKKEIGNLGGD